MATIISGFTVQHTENILDDQITLAAQMLYKNLTCFNKAADRSSNKACT